MSISPIRTLSEISEQELVVRLSVDLVSTAKRNLGFLRLISESHWLHHKPTLVEAIRRYDELWMPLICDLTVGDKAPIVLPPLDIEWVWYCHTLNPVSYRLYCESRFSKLIGKPAILNDENEDYALNTCRDIWISRYPSEPFENEIDSDIIDQPDIVSNEDLLDQVLKKRCLYTFFSEPYMLELVYLIAAKQRYKGFLYMMQKFADRSSVFIPTTDILLMWLSHQSYPTEYSADVKEMEGHMGKVVGAWECVEEEDVEETKKLWEKSFDEPYEKAGCPAIGGLVKVKPPVYWEVIDTDVNVKYKSMVPRFLLEVCVMVKLNMKTTTTQKDNKNEFLRLRVARCHKELKINKPISNIPSDSWQKAIHLYCEFSTKGVVFESRKYGGRCFKGSTLREAITFSWNDLLRAPSLTMKKEVDQKVKVVVSMTPPVQASYLLKCVPDRVTDDSGAMISDVILRMNQYRPQEGRWLSRTVLDHSGRECFVVRMRMGGGFWRRGGEAPSAVKWEDRIIEIREGSWSYVAGSIGRAPEKVVGTATPKLPSEGWQASWSFSTGDELSIRWESTSMSGICIDLQNQNSTDSSVRLLIGRQMYYQVNNSEETEKAKENEDGDGDEEENGFLTLVRFSEENPNGKATALLNWKLLVVELFPEEDAVLVLLLCMSILRSVTEMRKEDIGNLLVRRRLREVRVGERDWGSVILYPSTSPSLISSPYLRPWYWNAKLVMASNGLDNMTRQPALNRSAEEADDKLYKRGIIT